MQEGSILWVCWEQRKPIAKAGKTGTGRIPSLWENGPVSEIQRPHCPPAGSAPGRQTKDTRSGGYDIQKPPNPAQNTYPFGIWIKNISLNPPHRKNG